MLTCAIVAFRGRAWFLTYGDATAGLYLHIAAALLRGHLPYTVAWDFRPPGLFALYALALAAFGPYLAWNVLTSLALAATAIAVGLLARRCDDESRASTGWLAATAFVLLAPENDGVYGNAEVEISAFAAWSLWFALRDRNTFLSYLASGLLAGCALQCKLSALPLALLPALVAVGAGRDRRTTILGVASFALGFAAPIALEVGVYARAGLLALLISANVDATFARAGALNLTYYRANARYLLDQLRILAPWIELAIFARPASFASSLAAWGWVAVAIASIALEGEFFHYQFIVLSAPIALVGTLGLRRLVDGYLPSIRAGRVLWIAVLLATFAVHDYYETVRGARIALDRTIVHGARARPDETADVLTALRRVAPGERSVLLIGQSPYIYDALGISAPTRFTAPVVWLDPRLTPMGGPAALGEMQRLFDARPRVVVLSRLSDPTYDRARVRRVREWIAAEYRMLYDGNSFSIFRTADAT